jgi:hypothetical protein
MSKVTPSDYGVSTDNQWTASGALWDTVNTTMLFLSSEAQLLLSLAGAFSAPEPDITPDAPDDGNGYWNLGYMSLGQSQGEASDQAPWSIIRYITTPSTDWGELLYRWDEKGKILSVVTGLGLTGIDTELANPILSGGGADSAGVASSTAFMTIAAPSSARNEIVGIVSAQATTFATITPADPNINVICQGEFGSDEAGRKISTMVFQAPGNASFLSINLGVAARWSIAYVVIAGAALPKPQIAVIG